MTKPSHNSVSVRQVARVAKVSPSTVSLVLNNRPNVNARTRQRVQQTLAQLDYRRLPRGRPSRRARARQVAIVYGGRSLWKGQVSSLTRAWTRGILEVLDKASVNLLISGGIGQVEKDALLIDAIDARKLDGAIVIGAMPEDGYLRYLAGRNLATVVINRRPEFNELSAVTLDNYGSGRQVVNYFIERGHRRIGLFIPPDRYVHLRERVAGARATLQAHGLEPAMVQTLDPYEADPEVEPLCRAALDAGATAMFVESDTLAARCIGAWLGMGVRIPQDLSVIGCDDDELTTPVGGLSSVGHDRHRLGRIAAELLLELVADREHLPTRSLSVATYIVERDTSGPAPTTSVESMHQSSNTPSVEA